MDVLLVESDSARSAAILNLLAKRPQRVVRIGEGPIANGVFWPRHELTAAVLLGFEHPSIEKVRVLKRLWSSECAPPSFIVTLPGSPGEELLSQLLCGLAIRGDWSVQGLRPSRARRSATCAQITDRINVRAAATLSLERIMAIERVVAGMRNSTDRELAAA